MVALTPLLPTAEALAQEDTGSARLAPGELAGATGGGVVALLSDGWDFVSWPARLDRGGWAKVGAVIGAGALIFAADEEIQDVVRRNRDGWLAEAVFDVGDFMEPVALMGNTNPFYLAGIAVGYVSGWDKMMVVSQELLFSHWVAGGTRKVVREFSGRRHPRDLQGAYDFNWGESGSFPSGHTSTIVQVATVITHHLSYWPVKVVAWSLVGSVAYHRLHEEAHWASDVWIGGLTGYASAKLVIENREQGRLTLTPMRSPEGGVGLAVVLRH